MSRSLDDEDSTDGWGDGGSGWAIAFLVIGVVAMGLLFGQLWKTPSPRPDVRTVGEYGEP